MAMTQLWVLCTLTHDKAMSWGWLLWGMLWKVGLKEQRERKNKSKVTQELFEIKVKKNKILQEIQVRKEESHLHKWKRRENSKVKEYEKLGKIKWDKVEVLDDMSMRAKSQ